MASLWPLDPTRAAQWDEAKNFIRQDKNVPFRRLLATSPWLIYHVHPTDGTLLHVALELDPSYSRQLLAVGADPFRNDAARQTPFEKARAIDRDLYLELLTWHQERVDRDTYAKRNKDFFSEDRSKNLFHAARHGLADDILLYVDKKTLRVKDTYERTALHVAAIHGDPDTVRELLEAGARTNSTDNRRQQAIQLAARYHRYTATEIILHHKPPGDRILRSLLSTAIRSQDKPMAELFLQHWQRPDHIQAYLQLAIQSSDSPYMLALGLPKQDGEPWAEDPITLLHTALRHNRSRIVVELIKRQPELIHYRDGTGRPLLQQVIVHGIELRKNIPEMVEQLLSVGCDPNQTDAVGWTTSDYMIAAGEDPWKVKDATGLLTAWLPAVINDDPKLLPKDALPEELPFGYGPAHMMTNWGAAACLRQLNQPIDQASQQGPIDLNRINDDGQTALHLLPNTPSDRQQATAQALVDMGANLSAIDWSGRTPIDYVANRYEKPYAVLNSAGAPTGETLQRLQEAGESADDF